MVEDSNSYYGAKELDVDNVVFVHGSIDPWHAMGRTTDLNEDAPAIMIHGKLKIENRICCSFLKYNLTILTNKYITSNPFLFIKEPLTAQTCIQTRKATRLN